MGATRTLGTKVLVGVVAVGIMLGGTAGLAGAATTSTTVPATTSTTVPATTSTTAPATPVAGGAGSASKPHGHCARAGRLGGRAQRLQAKFTKKLAKLQAAETKAQAAAAKATTPQAKAYPEWLVKHYSRWIDRVKKEQAFRLNPKHQARMSHRASVAAACK